ncbi:MAG: substrate-binding domain-containing protein [Bacteroidetes bacterium]|nr:substrate-binding domain-containing protein [Bacteroidota bacterium]
MRKYRIGFSQCTNADTWRKTMLMEMQNELTYYPSLELITTNANNNSAKQIKDIHELLAENIDLLIVSPNESEPLTPIVKEVYKKGIPVILIDRKIESGDYTAFIGANNYQIGKEAGKYAVKLLKGRGRILEIMGLVGSSPARERHNGFIDEISKFSEIKIVKSESGEWENPGGWKIMDEALLQNLQFNLVYAHNDRMAMGAYNAFIKQKKKKDFFIIGIDGLPGSDGGIQAIIDKKFDATLLYPTGGRMAISLAGDILNKKPFYKENDLNTMVIDSANVQAVKAQSEEIITLHKNIEFSKQNLDIQVQRFYSQQFWLIVSLCSLAMVIILVSLLFRAYRNKQLANQKLEHQTQEIIRQNEELKNISLQLEEATQAKLRFFTNISHEFRTPLTLILGPLDNIISSARLTPELLKRLQMMHRNANRLLRLINQLMDLQKMDNTKMKLNAGNYDIIQFVRGIKESFDELSEKKHMEYLFTTALSKQELFFDKDKVDKILFNLLSNAFKFTSENGRIEIIIQNTKHHFVDEVCDAVEIIVKDNGIGISEKHLARIFELFYRGDYQTDIIFQGTGIGLALSKGFIDLHKGDLTVESKKGEGTSFFVYFRQGSAHINTDEIVLIDKEYDRVERQIESVTETVGNVDAFSKANSKLSNGFDQQLTILIVEDNPDVRGFIRDCLLDIYKVMEASNGKEAFDIIDQEEPDLIICDVMMPVMDGLAFTEKLKSDLRICHIPVILLTARSTHEQKIEGLETGADSYMPKPFNSKHLLVRVRKLIEIRQKIRKHYQENLLLPNTGENKISQLDSSFLKKCNKIIEKNIQNTEYGVEELSNDVGLSRVHVYRKIKHLTGLSVSEFIRNTKLNKAAVLLRESGKSIAEIAYETGFSSPSYFSKSFKDYYKISPSEFNQNSASDNG